MKHTKDGKLVLSDSMMKLYQDCGTRFWFTYLENPEEMPRYPALEFGTVLHDLFYEFFKRKNPDAKMYQSAANFANVFRGKWFGIDAQPKTERGRKKPPVLWHTPDEKEKLLGAGYKASYEFFLRNQEVPFSHVLVEHYFIISLNNEKTSKGYALQGYIDRLELKNSTHPTSFAVADLGKAISKSRDGYLMVIDYKSGYKSMDQHALDLDTQFSCYDLAVEMLYPFLERHFAIENIRDGSHIPTARGEGERRVLRERIFSIGRSIEKEKFGLASNMYKCSSCNFLRHCHSLQAVANRKGIHPEDLMRASSPFTRGPRRQKSLFEWQEGEIVRVVDEKRLLHAEKQRTKPVQLSFFMSEEEVEEEPEIAPTHQITERLLSVEESESVRPDLTNGDLSLTLDETG